MRLALLVALVIVLLAPGAAAAQPPYVSEPPVVRSGEPASTPSLQLGRELFAANCSTCHGSRREGVLSPVRRRGSTAPKGQGPPLIGVGRRAADFYLRTGYMPLDSPEQQPSRSRVRFSEAEIVALEDYVASLGGGPPIPEPHPERGSLSEGLELFTQHCAGCHQAVAEGGVDTGARVPPLDRATPVQIAQAVRIGPYVMPKFSESDITDPQLDSLIRYVEYTKDPEDAGGWGINHLGPFPEGMVTWGIAALALVLTCMVIGERLRRR